MRSPVPDRFRESADQYPGESFLLGAEGLQKFDLGMTPASVTPPPTWRCAAWFTVVASAAALGGLILTSSMLVGYSRPPREWGLPQEPPPGGNSPSGASAQGFPVLQGKPVGRAGQARESAGFPMVGGVVPGNVPGLPPGIPLVEPPRPDPSTTEAVRRRCEQYFAALRNGDLRGAYAMTSDSLHAAGFATFAVRYAAASSIEATEVTTEPGHAVASVRILWADGRVETQRRELWLSRGANPLILADNPMP